MWKAISQMSEQELKEAIAQCREVGDDETLRKLVEEDEQRSK